MLKLISPPARPSARPSARPPARPSVTCKKHARRQIPKWVRGEKYNFMILAKKLSQLEFQILIETKWVDPCPRVCHNSAWRPRSGLQNPKFAKIWTTPSAPYYLLWRNGSVLKSLQRNKRETGTSKLHTCQPNEMHCNNAWMLFVRSAPHPRVQNLSDCVGGWLCVGVFYTWPPAKNRAITGQTLPGQPGSFP